MKYLSLFLLCSLLAYSSISPAAAQSIVQAADSKTLLAAGAAGGAVAWLANCMRSGADKEKLERVAAQLGAVEDQQKKLLAFLVGPDGALEGDPIVYRLAAAGAPGEVVDLAARRQWADLDLEKLDIDLEGGKTIGSLLQALVEAAPSWNEAAADHSKLRLEFRNYVGICDANFKRARAEQEEYETTKKAFTEELRKINQKISALSTSDEVLTEQGLSASALEDVRSLKEMLAKATEISEAFEPESEKRRELEEKVESQAKLIALLMAHCNLSVDENEDSQS